MALPVVVVALIKAVASAVATEVGSKVGEALKEHILMNGRILDELRVINAKLDVIIHMLYAELPELIRRSLVEDRVQGYLREIESVAMNIDAREAQFAAIKHPTPQQIAEFVSVADRAFELGFRCGSEGQEWYLGAIGAFTMGLKVYKVAIERDHSYLPRLAKWAGSYRDLMTPWVLKSQPGLTFADRRAQLQNALDFGRRVLPWISGRSTEFLLSWRADPTGGVWADGAWFGWDTTLNQVMGDTLAHYYQTPTGQTFDEKVDLPKLKFEVIPDWIPPYAGPFSWDQYSRLAASLDAGYRATITHPPLIKRLDEILQVVESFIKALSPISTMHALEADLNGTKVAYFEKPPTLVVV